MTLVLPEPGGELVDPGQAFLDAGMQTAVPTVAERPIDRAAFEIAAAVLVMAVLMRRHLADKPAPRHTDVAAVARGAWKDLAPTWLRLAVPAIAQAYRLGDLHDLSEDELRELATDYAGALGDYVDVTSADAMSDGVARQMAGRWSAELAWHRATAAYGLDKRDMRSYLATATKDGSADPIPAAARTLVDRLMLRRSQTIGEQEAYSASQAGQVAAWIYLADHGRLPAGCEREWEMGANEEHCAVCAELAQQRVPLREPFILKGGSKLWAPRAHPGCYCRIRLRQPPSPLSKAAPIAAGLILVAADTKRVLMIQRAFDPKDPAGGKWEIPGGHLDGQAPLIAAIREWQEELHRKIPPLKRWLGIWRHGVYVGFAGEIASESMVPSHTRGRVKNPDDPKREQVEAIAWWNLKDLRKNPAVRAELLDSLDDVERACAEPRDAVRDTRHIAKAYDQAEPREGAGSRHPGRWAHVAEPTEKTELPPVSPLRDSPVQDSPLRPSPLRGSPLRESPLKSANTVSPLKRPFRSPFTDAHKPRPRPLQRNVVILLGQGRPDRAPDNYAHYMPVDDFHELVDSDRVGARYELHKMVDFDIAATRPIASANLTPWSMLSDDHVLGDSVSPTLSREDLEYHWNAIHEPALLGFNIAMTEPEQIVSRLTAPDLNRIYEMAGYDPGELDGKPETGRGRILHAVHQVDTGKDDSLAMAYGDYVVYNDPKRLLGGSVGRGIENALDEAEDAKMDVRSFDTPVPVQQVFTFERGFHPSTGVDKGEAFLDGRYVPTYRRYRSALHDRVSAPMRFGIQELGMEPFVERGGFWPGDAEANRLLAEHDKFKADRA